MLRFGIVDQIDAAKGLARVRFPEDNLLSFWLPVLVRKTKDDKFYHMVDVDEHVACMMDERCEDGVILGAMYSSATEPPYTSASKIGVKFSDDAEVVYDKETQVLTIITTGEVQVECGTLKVTGDVEVTGKIDATGKIKSDTDLEAGPTSLSFLTHVHPDITSGGTTGPPQPA